MTKQIRKVFFLILITISGCSANYEPISVAVNLEEKKLISTNCEIFRCNVIVNVETDSAISFIYEKNIKSENSLFQKRDSISFAELLSPVGISLAEIDLIGKHVWYNVKVYDQYHDKVLLDTHNLLLADSIFQLKKIIVN